jgi:hypothetical protein
MVLQMVLSQIFILQTQLSCQSHKLLISRYVLISQLTFADTMHRFDAINGRLG